MTSNGSHLEMTSHSSSVTTENTSVVAATTPQTVVIKGHRYRQLGPAPFASFEDLSDELDSPPETARVPLPGIKEDPTSQLQSPSTPLPQVKDLSLTEREEQCLKDSLTSSLDTPAPPRIDISRASSSSQHEDSITSSPERENGTHNLGYKEDGTIDLRSSTEELDYIQEPGTVQESEEKRKRERMMKRQQQVRDFGETQSQHEFMERKDSSCSVMSDVGLLCISGRTSRLSSIGSAASGGSIASGTSHLSAGSHLSGRSSRSPSPHKMLLETSFCGSKPMHPSVGEPDLSSSLVAAVEKAASRPPSRLRSRSPSPHKMLLETSFCGTKQIHPSEIDNNTEPSRTPKKKKKTPTVVTEAEIVEQKVSKPEAAPTQSAVKLDKAKRVDKIEKVKPLKHDQINPAENKIASAGKKTFVLPKKTVSKPKKIISIRDIPGDEIYIPLKGPEVDLEEIIRNASPNVQKKREKIEKPESADEIYIPLHSPPKSTNETDKIIFQQDVACTLPKSSVSNTNTKTSSRKVPETCSDEKQQKPKQEPKKRQYEVCEDGSIFIPLHSPDEDKCSNNFEEEIKRVDKELQKAREAAERRLKEKEEDEKQRKPATLDLSDSGSHKARLSQSYHSGKSEIPSGGSRTPSPGSTLSRKSSFASLFRKSDVFSSPESQSSSVRKKSGTFSNIIKDASDGLRERSRSRSKSKERQPQSSSSARSPSGKMNVFSNLFTKKKSDFKVGSGKENEQFPSRLHLQFTFPADTECNKALDEGDYIIIPLRDPSDPPDSLGVESEEGFLQYENGETNHARPSSPLVVLEKSESPRSVKKTKDIKDEQKPTRIDSQTAKKSSSKDSLCSNKKRELEAVATSRRSSSETKTVDISPPEVECRAQKTSSSKQSSGMEIEKTKQMKGKKTSNYKSHEVKEIQGFGEKEHLQNGNEADEKENLSRLQRDSSIETEEKSPKEEILTVTDSGIRKLKLPPEPGDLEDDHERKGLVYQESFEDELPYVPTTLPLERPVGVQIVPVKHRVNEIKTCSIERPRSTTPINPTTLEDFISSNDPMAVTSEEKMKISLPRDNSITSKSKSPTRFGGKGKTWFEFAEAVLQSPRDGRKSSLRTTPSPPPLPPRSSPPSVLSSSAPPTTTSWINFEELPEKRKLPKKITVIPTLRSSAEAKEKSSSSVGEGVVYSYVSPEDCQCECHEHNASHTKENDHERGQMNELTVELKSDGEFVKKDFERECKSDKTQKGSAKSGCKDCQSGIYTKEELDIEETPLLGVNSEDEDDLHLGKAVSTNRSEVTCDADKASHLSNSSECISQEALIEEEQNFPVEDPRPFAMDLEIDSSRSSVLSQDVCWSPDDVSNSLQ